jgi:DNA invertase Pin-like site-specific DNA recombinase
VSAVLRCAVYARFSSEKQSPLSIEDQVRKCRDYAAQRGWSVLDPHIYSDEAISGTRDDRFGLRRMLAAATSREKPFDVVLVDDTSRISRTLKDSFTIHDELRFAGVRLIFVSQGIDTESEQAEVLLATHGIVDSLYIRELAKKTHRGVEGRALQGLHTGGRCFGYRNVPIEDAARVDQHGRPLITGVRLEVREDEAGTVRRIFEMYAGGNSLQKIGKQLNGEGVISPQPQKGRISRSWCPSSIRTILRNERYRGRVIWGKTVKVRSKSGKRIYKRTPQEKWVVRELAEQRIVSEDLWKSVQNRIETVKQVYGKIGRKGGMQGRSVSSPYLFSGLLKCSECGANISIVSGRWRGRSDVVYGCPQNTFRGASVCTNSIRVFRRALEGRLLDGLQEQIMRPEAVEYVLERFEAELVKALESLGGESHQMRRRKEELESEVTNLANAIAQGDFSPALRYALADRERQIGEITTKLLEARPDSLRSKLRNIRSFVMTRMQDLRAVLNSDAGHVRAELAKHIDQITSRRPATRMSPRVLGILLGVAVSVVPGARFAPRVPRSLVSH